MKITCQKCGKDCLCFQTKIYGELHLCQNCDKKDIEMISKELLKLADSKNINQN